MYRDTSQPSSDVEANAAEMLDRLPKRVGALLLTSGMVTSMLPPPPGPFDMMLLLSGGLILWPRGFQSVKTWAEGRFPAAHRASMGFLVRFLLDLERRYPDSTTG